MGIGIGVGLCLASLIVPFTHTFAKRDLVRTKAEGGTRLPQSSGMVRDAWCATQTDQHVLDALHCVSVNPVLITFGRQRAVWIRHPMHCHQQLQIHH